MQEWSTVRKTWKDKRDVLHIAKGAAGVKLSIGSGIDAVAVAQAKGLKSFIEALGKFDITLTNYKKAIAKLEPKKPKTSKDPDYPKLLQWIDSNLATWVTDDKKKARAELSLLLKWGAEIVTSTAKMIPQEGIPGYTLKLSQAGEEDAKARGSAADEYLKLKPDPAKIAGVYADWVKELDDVIKVGDEAKQLYGEKSTVHVAKELADLRTQARGLKHELTVVMPKSPHWNAVLSYNQTSLNQGWLTYHMSTGSFTKAAKARIGP